MNNMSISINMNCIEAIICNVSINNNTNFLDITQYNTNSAKLILKINSFRFNLHGTNPGSLFNVNNAFNIDVFMDNINIFGNGYNLEPIFIQYSSPKLTNIFSLNLVEIHDINTPIYISNGGKILLNHVKIENCFSMFYDTYSGLLYFDNILSYHMNDLIMINNQANSHLIALNMQLYDTLTMNYFSNSYIYNNIALIGAINVYGSYIGYHNNSYIFINNTINNLFDTVESAIIVSDVANVWILNTDILTHSVGSGISLYDVLLANIDGCNISYSYYGLYTYSPISQDIFTCIISNSYFEHNAEYGIYAEYGNDIKIYDTIINDNANGIDMWEIKSIHIERCNMSHSLNGLYTFDTGFVNIFDSVFENNIDWGIYSDFDNNFSVYDTIIQNNFFGGISVDSTSSVVINRCNISHSSFDGLRLSNKELVSNIMVIISHSIIEYNGKGIRLFYIANVLINYCQFNHNKGSNQVGGGLVIRFIDKIEINHCHFVGNRAEKEGGAIIVKHGMVSMNNCVFIDNSAYSGGAIAISVYTNTDIEDLLIHNSYFNGNLAHDGGAIWNERGTYTLFNNTFNDNYAKSKGGAIHDAMSVQGCKINKTATIGDYNVFSNNKAYLGGAIYSTNCDFRISGNKDDESSFPVIKGNTAIMSGGGVLFDISDIAITNISVSHTKFINNTAISLGGGGLAVSGGNILVSQCIFDANKVLNKKGFGGAMFVASSDAFISTNTYIHIYECSLYNNHAPNGGAVAVQTLGNKLNQITIGIISTQIQNNHALDCGGGIYINGGTLINDTKIENNDAGVCGGGLYLGEFGSLQSFASYYNNNSADKFGGGISIASSAFMFIGDTVTNNTAGEYGGGVYLTKCPMSKSQNVYLENNSALISGGGYYIYQDALCNWTEFNQLIDNTAKFGDNYATFVRHVNFLWDIPLEFKRSDKLSIRANLLDGFGQKVIALSDNDEFIMTIMYTAGINEFEVIGEDTAKFNGIETDISFQLKPTENGTVFASDMRIPIIFNVTASLNGDIWKSSKSTNFFNPIYRISTTTQTISHILNGICSLCIIITAILMIVHWHKPVIKGSRVPFMLIILCGLETIAISLSYGMVEHHRGGCSIYIWILLVGLVLILSPISAKTWAIYHVFAYAEDLKDFMWDSKRLFLAFVLIPFILTVIYLIIWTVFDNGMIEVGLYYNTKSEYLVQYCPFNRYFAIIPFIVVLLSLILLSFLTLRSRHVPENWRESKYLGLCIFTFVILIIIFTPVTFLDFLDDSSKWLLRSLCGFIMIQSILTYLFYIKFFIVWNGGKNETRTLNKRHSVVMGELEAAHNDDSEMKEEEKTEVTKTRTKSKSINEYQVVKSIDDDDDGERKESKEKEQNDPNDEKLVNQFVEALELQEITKTTSNNAPKLSCSEMISPDSNQSTAL